MKKERNSRIELLRILSMVAIVAFHATRRIKTSFGSDLLPANRFFMILFGSWGPLGVCIFVIISAWYLCEQKFKLKKLLNIVFEYISYIFIFNFVNAFVKEESIVYAIKGFIEDLYNRLNLGSGYWFLSAYVLMYLLSPLLNKLTEYKNFKKVLIVLSFIPIYINFSGRGGVICSTAMFSYLYLLTVYIKRNNIEFKHSNIISLIIAIALILLKYIEPNITINEFIKDKICFTIGNSDVGSILITILAYSIFMSNIKAKAFSNKIINSIASYSLGVYCFHECTAFNVINFVTEKACTLNYINNSNFIYAYIILVFAIVVAAVIFETIRSYIIQKPFNYLISKTINFEKFDNWINSI